jgi:hypothetical protein
MKVDIQYQFLWLVPLLSPYGGDDEKFAAEVGALGSLRRGSVAFLVVFSDSKSFIS